jgi:hypothetical protein
MDMSEMEGMNMLDGHQHPWNQWPEVEGMDMVGIHIVEGMDMVEVRSSKERPEVEGMDMVDDMTVEVIEREHKGMVLVRHLIGDGVERHRRTH